MRFDWPMRGSVADGWSSARRRPARTGLGRTGRVIAVCLLLIPAGVRGGTLAGRVVGISDGDSLTVLDAGRTRHLIRLAGIDAPEQGQPFGKRAKENLSRLAVGQAARVDWNKRDRYGRLVGTLWVASPDTPCRGQPDCPKTLDAGLAQLAAGLAWYYRKYGHELDPQRGGQYEFAEQEARARKAGLWRDAKPVPPWDWRAHNR